MDIRQAEYVLAVVDHGTFTAAAASVPVSQPALSQAIRSLERELGIELFLRVGRNVVLSEAGRAFVPPARQLLADRERAIEAVASVVGLEGGLLDLVSLPTLAVTPLVELIGRFRGAHPAVAIRVREHEGTSGDALALVRDGTCEVGLVELPEGAAPAGLVAHALGTQEFLAVCPPGTPLRRKRSITVAELAELPLAATPEGTSSRRVLDEAFAAASLTLPDIAVESWHRELLGPLVQSGAAAALLPAPMAAEAAERGAVVAALDPPLRRTIGLVHRTGVLSPAADAFISLA
jgi:DNA-binding transcriptional LysR family regulator